MPSAPTIAYFNQHSQQPAASSQQPAARPIITSSNHSHITPVQRPASPQEGKQRRKERKGIKKE